LDESRFQHKPSLPTGHRGDPARSERTVLPKQIRNATDINKTQLCRFWVSGE